MVFSASSLLLAQAIIWFEKSVEIDPDPREEVRKSWLPYVRGQTDAKSLEELLATISWADPCE